MMDSLGLDRSSETVYRAMLAHPLDDAVALAARLGMAPQEIVEAYARLSELQLVQAVPDRPGLMRAISPELGLELLLTRQQAEFAAHRQRIAASRAAASQLITEYSRLHPAPSHIPGVDYLNGVAEIRACLLRLTDEVQQEVMAFVPDGGQTSENMEASRPLNESVLRRGVAMRTVYVDSVRNSQPTVEHANWITGLGGQVRTVATLPTRMTIVDRTTAIIPVDSEDSGAAAVRLSGHGTLTALCSLFENVWELATPLGEAPRKDPDNISRQDQAALKLLAEGHTDEGIAKRLGVSPRTARRIATTLMEKLGARSRFEAGVRAVRQGWLPFEP
ncbi:helix-turn-helix transcriptional regulator [Streptomyces sp. NPDC005438]|uniref:helix-turn-helix transcriptional regulator n=1 Tax=Streptomyces sp. NPDC005438 TaxID=3156880 RepID=UPI0033BCE049